MMLRRRRIIMKCWLGLIPMLSFCLAPRAVPVGGGQTVQEGRYVNVDRPQEYILIKDSKIYFHISIKGWGGEEGNLGGAEYDIGHYPDEPDGKIVIFGLTSGNPLLFYEFFWDYKKKRIVQNERVSKRGEKPVIVRVWSKQKQ